MINLSVIAIVVLLLLITLMVALYPFRRSFGTVVILCPLIIVSIGVTYFLWGGWIEIQKNTRKQQILSLLRDKQGTQKLIEQIKARLAQNPKSAQGWYLLGRLYASQGQWKLANDAYLKATQLAPSNKQYRENYEKSN